MSGLLFFLFGFYFEKEFVCVCVCVCVCSYMHIIYTFLKLLFLCLFYLWICKYFSIKLPEGANANIKDLPRIQKAQQQ